MKKSWNTRRGDWVNSVNATLNCVALSKLLLHLEAALKTDPAVLINGKVPQVGVEVDDHQKPWNKRAGRFSIFFASYSFPSATPCTTAATTCIVRARQSRLGPRTILAAAS